ncbi:MAG TPA: CoA pyrophosphatase [Candidatus Limnocylindrales bacterium]|nr:CoA pyrophosphatase [Candidatus Limnocylindrales bacterium]
METFEVFIKRLTTRLQGVKFSSSNLSGKPAAVLIPFYEKEREPHLLLTKRTQTLPHHKGQVCFPGGSQKDGEPLQLTALRETYEELRISPEQVEILGQLESIQTRNSGFLVTPVVGVLWRFPGVYPNPFEVEEVLSVPWSFLANPLHLREQRVEASGSTLWVPAYTYQTHIIWGLTVQIIKQLIKLLT